MAKKRTKEQKIRAQQRQMSSTSANQQISFVASPAKVKPAKQETENNQVANLLMSKPAEIKADLLKTVIVTFICLLCLAAWYWKLKISGA